MRNRSISITFATLLLVSALPAQALPVTIDFGGFINFDNANPFGATFGDSITGSADYDDAGLTNAAFETQALAGLNLTSLGFGFPLFNPSLVGTFSSNTLIGVRLNDIVFDSSFTAHNFLMTGGAAFDIFDGSGFSVLGGCLDFGTSVCTDPLGGPVAEVPEPGTLALFGIGLLGMWAGTRRQQGRQVSLLTA